MTQVIINGTLIQMFGKVKGNNNNKFNRAAKLAYSFEELDAKFNRFIEKGSCTTENARCALALRLMMYSGIRVGNEGSAEGYMTKPHPNSKKEPEFVQTYGLTSITKEHILFKRKRCYLNFVGKKQVENSFILEKDLSIQLLELHDNYQAETLFDITAYQLTKFIKRYVGKQFSPKDFRTMKANIEAWNILGSILNRPRATAQREIKAEVKEIALHVSECLNNTPSVCKKSYIDDMLFIYHQEQRFI